MNSPIQNEIIATTDRHRLLRNELMALVPQLRAFSRALCVRRETAEDIARRALTTAWRHCESLERKIDLRIRLFEILHIEFHTSRQQGTAAYFEAVEEGSGRELDRGANCSPIEFSLHRLPVSQRAALILIASGRFSYADAARICGARIGTVRSRVARGRLSLSRILAGDLPLPRQNESASQGLAAFVKATDFKDKDDGGRHAIDHNGAWGANSDAL